jgi:glycerol uptake facilitator-like aquaporin
MKKYIAEAFGTCVLTTIVALSLGSQFPVATPLLAALTLATFVYALGHVSGTHINPAVTLGLWGIKKIETKEALSYVVSQCIGAFVALLFVGLVKGAPLVISDISFTTFVAEFFGTLLFTFGIASVVYGKVPKDFSGVVIGASLLLGIAVASTIGSNGVLNPAVAFGIGSFNLLYILGPIFGSIVGMKFYKLLSQ